MNQSDNPGIQVYQKKKGQSNRVALFNFTRRSLSIMPKLLFSKKSHIPAPKRTPEFNL
jgi:hypothetical protein